MEALAAFALACNVLQVIDFGKNAVILYKQISKHGTPKDHHLLRETSAQISTAARNVQAGLQGSPSSCGPLNATETQLQDVARHCVETAGILQQELEGLQVGPHGSLRDKIKKFGTIVRKRSSIAEIERCLAKYQSILETSILVHMKYDHPLFDVERLVAVPPAHCLLLRATYLAG